MQNVKDLIIEIRNEKVILDYVLADLYGVKTKALKQAVKRNIERFPSDFMFILTGIELQELRSQIVTSNAKSINRAAPMAFTELGVAMLSSVLNNQKATDINIQIIRTFVLLRKALLIDSDFKLKLETIEKELNDHSTQLNILFELLDDYLDYKDKDKQELGFKIS